MIYTEKNCKPREAQYRRKHANGAKHRTRRPVTHLETRKGGQS